MDDLATLLPTSKATWLLIVVAVTTLAFTLSAFACDRLGYKIFSPRTIAASPGHSELDIYGCKECGVWVTEPPERSAQTHFQCPLVKFPAQLRSDSIGHGGAHYFVSLTHLCPVFALFGPN